ncbi:DUF1778 domain-containing protein [Accumulibacter sp.]|uniref:type II toxin-antitoxin system TacA family antitoxin n=1 Tax=Accumulibacter sp. TaxID=2053492 RepID=UPI0025EDA8CD|nr:DUF1778 domain-containing protein [Accumulibacter sp.]
MLEAACERTQAILVNRARLSLDAGKFQQFLDLLNAPPRPSEGLDRRLALKASWDEG